MKSLIRLQADYDLAWVEVAYNRSLSTDQQREAWLRFVALRAELNERVGQPSHSHTFHQDEFDYDPEKPPYD